MLEGEEVSDLKLHRNNSFASLEISRYFPASPLKVSLYVYAANSLR
jgi:hypothetical protein